MKHSFVLRLLSLMLAMVMVVGMMPVSAFAQEADGEEVSATTQETSGETTEAAEETTEEATEGETEDATEGETEEATEGETEAAEETTEVTEEATEAAEETTEATEEATEATEEETTEEETEEETDEETEESTEETESEVEFYADEDFVSETHDVFKRTTSTIAPGVTQDIVFAYAKDGKQMAYYVATADITRDDVVVQTSYKDQYVNKQFGMAKLTEQIAFADELYTDETSDRFISEYYKVVAGVNASFYNMTTGQPSGVTYLDGVQIGESASYNQFFAILKDGTAVVDYTSNLSKYEGNIWQAVAGSQMLVYNGVDTTLNINGSYNTDRHSRTCVGVTADGKVVIMSLDGRQEPFSCGGTMHELAQIMLEAGCVGAINLDGGGSTTFAARQEGADSVTIINRPSDGSERSISSGLIIASLAVPSNVFERATLTAEHDYVTPGSVVTVTAAGVSPAGTAAEIPENAQWQVADAAMGTVEGGVYTAAADFVGQAVIQMTVDGAVVGQTTVNVVIPESISFNSSVITIPYGKTVALEMTAVYGLNEVALKAGDVIFTLAEEKAGTVSGFDFTGAAEESGVSGTAITAALSFDATITAAAQITLGKGSQVIFDFEDGTTGCLRFSEPDGTAYNYVWPESYEEISNDRVHSGNYAMRMEVNYSNSLESGYQKTSLVADEAAVFENATRVGMWIYIPDEAVGLWARWTILGVTAFNEDGTYTYTGINGQDLDGTANGGSTGYVSQFQESGWHYLSIDTSAYAGAGWKAGQAIMQFYISDRDGSAFGYDASDYSNITGKFVFYVDDITVDYSSAVDDREPPVFTSVRYAYEGMSDAAELNGQTVPNNTVSFGAVVHENTNSSNYTGLDGATAKAYVDGVQVPCTYAGGILSVSDRYLTNGLHTVKFSICDKMGNYASAIRNITVSASESKSTIRFVPRDAGLNRILFGSVYYMDLVASAIEEVESVSVTIDLDNLSTWELRHMEPAEGFSASYSVDADENIAKVTVTRTGASSATGEAVLLSMPARVWELEMGYTYPNGTKAGSTAFTYAQFKSMKEFWRISLIAEMDKGVLTRTDGTTGTFSGRIFVDTEMWAEDADMLATSAGTAYYGSWNGGHIHSASALEDKAATCTESGYSGRTYCAVCSSVVEWGTTIKATGHSYADVDGVLKCTNEGCDVLFNGQYTDGKYYENGVLVEDGWNGSYYYVSGQRLTGVQKLTAPDASGEFYYFFEENGVCTGKYTGVFFDSVDSVYRYSKLGELASGWQQVDNDWYYFRETTMAAPEAGYVYWSGVPYQFEENGKLISGLWIEDEIGFRYYYGPDYYRGGGSVTVCSWYVIDGYIYCIDQKGYRYEGKHYVIESNSTVAQWYDFGEDGIMKEKMTMTGLLKTEEGLYYLENGISKTGLVYADGSYYYFAAADKKAVAGGTYTISNTNGYNIKPGAYVFDAEGRMQVDNGIVEKDGVLYYYVDGVLTAAGMIEIDGTYYYVRSNGQLAIGEYYCAHTNDLMDPGYYTFGEDGKMIVEEPEEPEQPKNGIVQENGALYYYVDGVLTAAGMIEIDGAYYYVRTSGQLAVGYYYCAHTNDVMAPGYYTFGEDGKMIVEEPEEPEETKNGIVEENGGLYYYVDGVLTAAGMIEIDGAYYYVRTSGQLAVGSYYCAHTNDVMAPGVYNFAEDGKMIIEPEVELKNGIVEEDGVLYYYVDGVITGVGMIQIGEDYYYVRSSGKLAIGEYYCAHTNDIMEPDFYTFGEDGKMIIEVVEEAKNGIVEENGGLYYYVNGVLTAAGLIEIDGTYYYVRSSGQLAVGEYYCAHTNGILEPGFYTFDETTGAMIQ